MSMYDSEYIKTERIDGRVVAMSPSANPIHSYIISNIIRGIDIYMKDSVCQVFGENIDVFLEESKSDYYKPDVFIMCNKSDMKSDGFHGVPKFIVEVVSPSSAKMDYDKKKKKYEQVGVLEYWIIDYVEMKLLIYYNSEGNKFDLLEEIKLSLDKEHWINLKSFPHVAINTISLFKGIPEHLYEYIDY